MKKVIFAFMFVVAATIAQAAQINWSTPFTSTPLTTGQAYLIMVTDTSAFSVSSSLEISGGSVVASSGFQTDWYGKTYATSSYIPALAAGTYYFAILMTTDGVEGTALPTTGSYALDMNGGHATDFYTVAWDPAGANSTLAPSSTDLTVAVTNALQPIPEPTVLALLALGVAGLALKRKNA